MNREKLIVRKDEDGRLENSNRRNEPAGCSVSMGLSQEQFAELLTVADGIQVNARKLAYRDDQCSINQLIDLSYDLKRLLRDAQIVKEEDAG